MKEKYKLLLNKTYELEGLLLLALGRDTLPQNLESLIEQKRRDILSLKLSDKPRRSNIQEMSSKTIQEQSAPKPIENHITEYRIEEKETEPEEVKPVKKEVEKITEPYYNLEDDEAETRPAPPKKKVFVHGKRRPVFSLNDRFLFIRELFEGDASAFNCALDGILTTDSYQDAEDYLINEFKLDPEGETDSRFFEIIRSSFGSR